MEEEEEEEAGKVTLELPFSMFIGEDN